MGLILWGCVFNACVMNGVMRGVMSVMDGDAMVYVWIFVQDTL